MKKIYTKSWLNVTYLDFVFKVNYRKTIGSNVETLYRQIGLFCCRVQKKYHIEPCRFSLSMGLVDDDVINDKITLKLTFKINS